MKRWLLLMASTATLLWSMALPLQAESLIIGVECSLAEAIAAANTDSAVGACPSGSGDDSIRLTDDTILSAALPAIDSPLTIDGDGHSISGAGKYRIFDVIGGQLTVVDLTLIKGTAPEEEYGGAIRLQNGALVTVGNSTLTENAAARGGAIALDGGSALSISESSFQGNKAGMGGGAIYADGGSVRVSDSQFEANCATRATHIVETSRGSAEAARLVDSDGCLRVAYYWSSAEEMVDTEQGDGGAISFEGSAQVSIENVRFSNNKATNGGAIAGASESGVLTITGSSFSGNLAAVDGGALDTHGGTVEIAQSSFVQNKADGAGGMLRIGAGPVQVTNTTIHGNRAGGHGGVAALDDGELIVTHATMKENGASLTGAGAIANWGGIVKLRNSIIDSSGSHEDCVGALEQIVGMLSRDGTCGHFRSDDPLLGELTGEPAWHPLGDGSPAIDAADPAYCPEADQRATARPYGAGCDIGAVETTTAAPPIPDAPEICPLPEQIVAANTDAPFGACPAGAGPDVFYLTRDFTLDKPLPQITSDITIEGNGYTLSGDGRFRIFDVRAGKLTINNLTLADGDASARYTEYGGAIRLRGAAQVVLNDSMFRNNKAQYGGAIAMEDNTTRLTINRSGFVGNRAVFDGGALYTFYGGVITIENSSFVRNFSQRGDGTGGAISAQEAVSVDISNSTFFRNIASIGGAIYGGIRSSSFHSSLSLALTHVTMLNNAGYGTGIYIEKNNRGSIRLLNSVIVGRGETVHCHARLAQNSGNFIHDGSCSPKLSGDPMLEEPSDFSASVSPAPGSPLIRAADPRFCTGGDQLGRARAVTGPCDIGAIETEPGSRALSDCAIKTIGRLSLRNAPDGERIGAVSAQATYSALARTPRWFKVDHQGARGWISADYVTKQGSCE
ncbi:MAG: SH3 domain-containing protein [Chloroflexi bacterium]|nr:SH3 domain-containing protein [Chloroflexota bacterium]